MGHPHYRKKQIIQFIRGFDLFTKPVQLLIKKEESHKTIFGAVMSCALIAIFGYLLFGQVSDMLSRVNPATINTEMYHPAPDYYKLSPNNFTLTFALQFSNYSTYIDESIYIATASIVKKTSEKINGDTVDNWASEEIPLVPCSPNLIKQKELSEYFSHLNLQSNLCIDWNTIDKISIEGTFDAPIFELISIQFNICTEKTRKANGPPCREKSEIKELLNKNFFSIQMSSNTIDLKNPNTPHQPKGEDIFTTISSKIFKEISIYLQPLTTQTDSGLIGEDIQIIKSLRYQRYAENIDINEEDNFLNIAIRLDRTEALNYRVYPKLQDILGNIGGLWQVLFAAVFIIQQPISNLSYSLSIMNSLFCFEGAREAEDEESDDQINSSRTLNQTLSHKKSISSKKGIRVAHGKLQSILKKNKQLEGMDGIAEHQNNNKKKSQISQAISNSIKQYFQIVSRKLRLSCTDYIYFCPCCCKIDQVKGKQIQFASEKIIKQLDILQIIKKLQEIDKLKMILLNQNQIKMFDYLPKPFIPQDPTQRNAMQSQYFSILHPVKSSYKRALEGKKALKELLADADNPINRKLVECMDEKILDLLKLEEKEQLNCSSSGDQIMSQDNQQQLVLNDYHFVTRNKDNQE